MIVDMSTNDWTVMYVNEAWEKQMALSRMQGQGKRFWDIYGVS